ncbi:MAG: ergothioneine biosynthesis protein EgtB [Planctomycetota bacterium]|jgi:ergothioneine biosynthesis protein EgtB
MTTAPHTSRIDSNHGEGLDRHALLSRYQSVRTATERLCAPLATEDYVVQTMTDVSPTKWHLGHTSWFFEKFILSRWDDTYKFFDESFIFLFNSYYNAVGPQFQRSRRGQLSRPTVKRTFEYRAYIDVNMASLLLKAEPETLAEISELLEIGINHEQQHQELIVTDIKHVFASNPMRPVYSPSSVPSDGKAPTLSWRTYSAQQNRIGHDGSSFSYDNETPRHQEYIETFQLASRLVTNGEYIEFITDDGYKRAELWLSDGWHNCCENQWSAPLYWEQRDGRWWHMTLGGMREVNPAEPVSHVSYYEADAYARWADAWLPTEAAWEIAAVEVPIDGVFLEEGTFHPRAAASDSNETLIQMFGDVWEWTCSPYVRYPGFRPAEGALGEYNAKFMSNQIVLRGGSCATPRLHIRPTYRNFFPPQARWQFSGFRLSREVK